jgi:hypothetical protein
MAEVVLAWALIACTASVYLLYTPFEDWSYLRFMMPAIVLLLVLSSAVVATISAPWGGKRSALTLAAAAMILTVAYVGQAESRLAFAMRALEQRYRSAGLVVRDRLPSQTVVLTTWDSGAIRFHGRRDAVIWDALDPAWLDPAIEWLASHGHKPVILLESWEEPRFRERFSGRSAFGALDWPPRFEVDRLVRIYDPADRQAFMRGERVGTEYVWPLLLKPKTRK